MLDIRSELLFDRAIEEPGRNEGRGRNHDQPAKTLWHDDNARDTSRFAKQAKNARLRGDNVAAVSSINRCAASRSRRAALAMRLLGRLEITGGWSHDAKHIPGVQDVVADIISRWSKEKIARNLQTLVQGEWREQTIGKRGCEIFVTIL